MDGGGIVEVVVSFTTQELVLDDITFVTNDAPTADAGPDQRVVGGPTGAEVRLDGSGSTDGDGDPLTYTWTGPFEGGTATGPTPTVRFSALGTYEVTLAVSDGTASATDTVTIEVAAATASPGQPAGQPTGTPAAPRPGSRPPAAAPVVARPGYAG